MMIRDSSVTLSFKPQGKITQVPWSRGMTVQRALEKAYDVEHDIPFVTRYYGEEFGQKVIMIDNMWDGDYPHSSSDHPDRFWLLYVNGEFVDLGIDKIPLREGNRVEFNYEPFSEQLLLNRKPAESQQG